jgi:hypothetical protein
VAFYHYDFYSQALAKIERGHSQDRVDVAAILARRLVEPGGSIRIDFSGAVSLSGD